MAAAASSTLPDESIASVLSDNCDKLHNACAVFCDDCDDCIVDLTYVMTDFAKFVGWGCKHAKNKKTDPKCDLQSVILSFNPEVGHYHGKHDPIAALKGIECAAKALRDLKNKVDESLSVFTEVITKAHAGADQK
jgi:hypothetical protein